ncbi:hypothetical protein SDC9_166509 [bioreactor metagenome]|uniref:Uncharacterized protein n=1 Tax=bioreactor metagenome TaxID=1076179 RepID=A0A645G555_9ZZZZ
MYGHPDLFEIDSNFKKSLKFADRGIRQILKSYRQPERAILKFLPEKVFHPFDLMLFRRQISVCRPRSLTQFFVSREEAKVDPGFLSEGEYFHTQGA